QLRSPLSVPTLPTRPTPPLFPYTTLFRSQAGRPATKLSSTTHWINGSQLIAQGSFTPRCWLISASDSSVAAGTMRSTMNHWQKRSEEHTSELQSRFDLVCRLLLEKKKTTR